MYQSRVYCGGHRRRWYLYGDPLGVPAPRRVDLAGQRFGTLTALEYSSELQGWLCRCDCGIEKHVRTWSLTSGGTRSCGQRSRHTPPASYGAMHTHLRDELGSAAEYSCARCTRPAQQWSYRRRGASMRLESAQGPWSTSVNDYEPLCVSCHKLGDLRAIDAEQAERHGAVPLWAEP